MPQGVNVDESPKGWTLRFEEPLVTQLRVDYQFSLVLAGGALIAIGEPFELRTPQGNSRVPPNEVVSEVGAALPLFNQQVKELCVQRSGELLIEFESGVVIRVPINERYENWALSWPDQETWVGLPGGGVSRFPPGAGPTFVGERLS